MYIVYIQYWNLGDTCISFIITKSLFYIIGEVHEAWVGGGKK